MRMEIRAFIAAYPSTEALERILAFREQLRERMPRSGARWAKEEQLHLTLQFFEALPKDCAAPLVETLAESLSECSPLSLRASFVGPLWDRCKVLGLKIDGDGLPGLVERVAKAVSEHGLNHDKKEFHGHLTLARLEDPRLMPRLEKRMVAEWTVDSIYLVKSELGPRGAAHTILAKVPLGSGDPK